METEDSIRVMLELPGFRPEDVNVDLEGNLLTISGEKRETWTEGEERNKWHLSERRFGRFTRSFILPQDVEQDNIEARYEYGVLYLNIPKSEKVRRRRIEIQGGHNGSQTRQLEGAGSSQK